MNTFMQVQVQFNAGVVKTFIAPQDIRLADFASAVRAYGGKFRSMRFQPDVSKASADALVQTGNAIMLEARHVEA